MRARDTLLNGITLSRVTNARIATSLRPRLTTGFGEHHWASGLGSRMAAYSAAAPSFWPVRSRCPRVPLDRIQKPTRATALAVSTLHL